ncbi:hypothetical protein HID58_018820 [Brassica napus]|uniref:Uncharacterized protein n=1 Tax=Brassica napus TaxID=3708 RepID=A0ABQ8DB06_BRANA|nr:hypothetical protein HID58_018820 [Brassica napus]
MGLSRAKRYGFNGQKDAMHGRRVLTLNQRITMLDQKDMMLGVYSGGLASLPGKTVGKCIEVGLRPKKVYDWTVHGHGLWGQSFAIVSREVVEASDRWEELAKDVPCE